MVACKDHCADHEYSLTGPQVEPSAGLWQFCAKLRIVSIDELRKFTDDENDNRYFPPYPLDDKTIKDEFNELLELQRHRDDPCFIATSEKCDELPKLCRFEKKLPGRIGCRRPLSRLWNLCPYPLGGVLVNRFPGQQVVRTGRGLARAIENETPGLYHRHIADLLMKSRNWSPPRQALVWAALDIAIASALQAAWYYKWVAQGREKGKCTAYRERPAEYAHRKDIKEFQVLFDHPDELNPTPMRCPDSFDKNVISAGTPRHPAYPSGHSTYSAAGAEILKFFFGKEKTPPYLGAPESDLSTELDNFADNIGVGRMWAGVHWRSDHEAGQKLGRVVACLVLQQLASMRTIDDTFKVITFNLCPPEPAMPCDPCKEQGDCKNDEQPPLRSKLCKAADDIAYACPPSDDTKPLPADGCDPPPKCKGEAHMFGPMAARIAAYGSPRQGGGNP
ncbi:MAG TPA: vanadium-dependent haloperoxidase [Thermoanaerobaculia bacterium]